MSTETCFFANPEICDNFFAFKLISQDLKANGDINPKII